MTAIILMAMVVITFAIQNIAEILPAIMVKLLEIAQVIVAVVMYAVIGVKQAVKPAMMEIQ